LVSLRNVQYMSMMWNINLVILQKHAWWKRHVRL